jgi:serine/threonine protein kinase
MPSTLPDLYAVLREFAERLARGESPTAEEYAAKYPSLAAEIRAHFGTGSPPTLPHAPSDAGTVDRYAPGPDGTRTFAPPAPPPADRFPRVAGFEILGELGAGAFGQVYLARQLSLGREVALKVARHAADPSAAATGVDPATGRNEGRLLAGLEHDNIVKVFSEFRDPDSGARGLCLQYVPGADLGTVLRRLRDGGRVPRSGADVLAALDAVRRGEAAFDPVAARWRDNLAADDFPQAVCRLGGRLAEALAVAHDKGVLHCDVKPGNILLTPYARPMLADFNVAFDRARRAAVGVGGTVAYMAPEHRAAATGADDGRVDERCDVYSLGVVLHELATGRRPAARAGDGDPLREVPRELAAVVRRCLAPDPADRYQTAAGLAAALSGAWHLLAARRALPPPSAAGRWVTARPVLALALAAALPHLAASVVNISYNAVEVRLDDAQLRAFAAVTVGYNAVVYPVGLGTMFVLIWRIKRGMDGLAMMDGPGVDALRRRVLRLGWQSAVLGVAGWFPGGVAFPLAIDLAAGPVGWATYAHYLVSFALAGLVGVVFTYLLVAYVALRALLPRLGNPDAHTPAAGWAEVRPLTAPFGLLMVLACAVPLAGAVLLIATADGAMTLEFRVLVGGLIGVGVAGVGLAERLTRCLRTLAAVWHPPAPR